MANARQFAANIKRRGKQLEKGINDVVVKAALAISQTVTTATPVDTGRARGNWQASIGTPIRAAIERLDPSGGQTIAANARTIEGRQPEQTIYLSNNLPYINRLNDGYSAQAPANFVRQAVISGANSVKRTGKVFK